MQKISITVLGELETNLLAFQRCVLLNLSPLRKQTHPVKYWISTCFKVLNRFCNYVLQRRLLRRPKHSLRLRRLEFQNQRNVLRRGWLTARHILDAEQCHIRFPNNVR